MRDRISTLSILSIWVGFFCFVLDLDLIGFEFGFVFGVRLGFAFAWID